MIGTPQSPNASPEPALADGDPKATTPVRPRPALAYNVRSLLDRAAMAPAVEGARAAISKAIA